MQKVPAVSPEYRSLNRAMGAINENFEELTPIIGYGEDREALRRVGPGLDFETFHEAMMWATTVTVDVYTVIVLQLEEGLYFAGDYRTTGTFPSYIIANRAILIRATGRKAKAVITVGNDVTKDYTYIFQLYNGGQLALLNVDIDVTAGGHPEPWTISAFYAAGNSLVSLRGSNDITAAYPLWINGSTVEITAPCHLTSIAYPVEEYPEPGTICLYAYGKSSVKIWAYTFKLKLTGLNIGMQARDGSTIVYNPEGIIYDITSGKEKNTNPPLNTIDYDGSFISDMSEPLTFAQVPPA